MAQLENITAGAKVVGLEGGSEVHVVAAKWHGTNAITVTYKNSSGHVAEQILYREDESRLNVTDGNDLAPRNRASYNVRKKRERQTKELKEDGKEELHS